MKKFLIFLVWFLPTHLLPLVDPIDNFKASGFLTQKIECGDTSPVTCLMCMVVWLCVSGAAENMTFSTSSAITLGCCDARIQDVVALETRMLWTFPLPLRSSFHTTLLALNKCILLFNVVPYWILSDIFVIYC